VTKKIKQKKLDEKAMVRLGERFFTSLGLAPLPDTFWERSLFKKPADRDVVCHASAWDVTYSNDLRIKMCIEPKEEDLITIHHELGHDYYFHYYYKLPILFQGGANDGFHEGIGDTLTLSVTPAYLKSIGLLDKVPASDKGEINVLLKMALEKVAFLPFGKLIDQWRWDVFSGKTKPSDYNKAWWALRLQYQGVSPRTRGARAISTPAPNTMSPPTRRTCVISWRASTSSSSTGRSARPPGTTGRCTPARSTAARRPGRSSGPCWRWGRAAPGPRRSRRSAGRRRRTPGRCWIISRRSGDGSPSRTRGRPAGGEGGEKGQQRRGGAAADPVRDAALDHGLGDVRLTPIYRTSAQGITSSLRAFRL